MREITRFGSRADAELLAARGSRQNFWLVAAPNASKEISVVSGRAVGL